MLIDTVQKNIRESNREETEADIAQAAKKMYEQIESCIGEYKKGNADTSELESQLAVLKEFVPASLSPEKTEEEVKKLLSSLAPEERNLKTIMPQLKDVAGIDMKLAKGLVEKLL